MTWATEQVLPAMQKIVLLMMANRTNHDTGLCYPSHDLLAKECGMSKRAMIDNINRLEAAGLIVVFRSKSDKGNNNVNKYRLNLHVQADVIGDKNSCSMGGSAADALGGSAADTLGGSAADALGVVQQLHPNQELFNQEKDTATQYPKKTAEKRGERLELEMLPMAWRQFCLDDRPELNPDIAFARFRDYWIAQPGAKGRKLDWFATWRNWVRNEKGASNGTHQQSGQQRKLSAVELVQQASRRYEDAQRRREERVVGPCD